MLEVLMVTLTDNQTLDLGVEIERITSAGDAQIRLSSLFGLGIRGPGGDRTAGDASGFTGQGKSLTFTEFLTPIVPSSAVAAFAQGDILQIVFFSVLFGVALTALGESGRPLAAVLDTTLHVFFGLVSIVMRVAPIGAFGAMAFTVGTRPRRAAARPPDAGRVPRCLFISWS